jgi:hypothetical protein
MKRRYVISPGIWKQCGKEPAFVAGIMLGKTLDEMLYENKKIEREAWGIRDLIIGTGLPRNPVKNNLRKLVKHNVVVETLLGIYRLTWTALLHLIYVRDQIVELANDGLYETAARYQQMIDLRKHLEAQKAETNESEGQHSEGSNDPSLQGRIDPPVHTSTEHQETEEKEKPSD